LTRAKYLTFFTILLAICIFGAIAYHILSGRTFYADIVAQKMTDAISSAGDYEISWNSLSGNPITGVSFSGVIVSSSGSRLMSAENIFLRLALSTLASPNPRLASVTISGLDADYESLSGSLPAGEMESPSAPFVDRVNILDSTFTIPDGVIGLKKAEIRSLGPGYSLEIDGSFNEKEFLISGKTDVVDGITWARDIDIKFDRAHLTAEGAILPSLDIKCDIDGLDMTAVGEMIPAIRKSALTGKYSASLVIKNDDASNLAGYEVSGTVFSPDGWLWKFPFRQFTASVKYSGNNVNFQGLTADLFSGSISGAANLKIIPDKSPNIVVKLDMNSLDTNLMASEFPWMSSFKGTLSSGACNISGFLDELSGHAEFFSPSMSVEGFSCRDIKASIDVKKSASLNIDFLGNIMGSSANGKALVMISDDVTVSADIALPGLAIESLGGQFDQIKEWNLKGITNASLHISGPASRLSYRVDAASQSVNILDSYSLGDVTAEILYSGDTLILKSANGKWQNATIAAEGSAGTKPNAPTPLAFKGSFSNLDIVRLSSLNDAIKSYNIKGMASGKWEVGGDSAHPAASVDLAIPRLSLMKDLVLNDVRAAAGYEATQINLASSSAKLGNSSMSASGIISLENEGRPVGYNIKGSFQDVDPSILSRLGIASADLSGKFTGDARVWKTGTAEPSFRVYFKNSNIKYAEDMDLSGINGTLTYSGGGIALDHLRTSMNTGNVTLTGTVGNVAGWQKPSSVPLDITASVTSADIGRMSRIFNPLARGVEGILNGSATLKGNLASPQFKAEGDLRGIRAFGLFLPLINLKNITGNEKGIDFPDIRAIVGRGVIQASGRLQKAEDWTASLTAKGTSVDIRSLTFSLDDDTRRAITGALDFNFEGSGAIDSFSGKGHAHVPSLSALGLNMSDADADFSVSDGFVIVEDSRANAYGGTVQAQVVKDLNLSNWGGRVTVKSADMAPAFHDLFPDTAGSITGHTNFTMRFIGDSKRTSMQDGDGSLEVLDGEILGFEGVESVSKIIGGKPLRFRSANFSFNLDGNAIYIWPGSRVSAPREDPVYRYVMFDGSVTTEQEVDLSCMGNVNIRALNALAEGVMGVLSAAIDSGSIGDSEMLLQNFLGSTIKGFAQNEFRDVNLKVSGKPGQISFSDIKIDSPVKASTVPAALAEPASNKGKTTDEWKLQLVFPVGPGEKVRSSQNVGGQIGSQLFDQILKSLIFDDE